MTTTTMPTSPAAKADSAPRDDYLRSRWDDALASKMDPVERLISEARAVYDKVSLFPDQTPENWINFITLRNFVPKLCQELRHANKKLKEVTAQEETGDT